MRGENMAAAAQQGRPHGMLSIIGLEDAKLEGICAEARGKLGPGSVCQVANFLFPAGRVVSGHKDALEEVGLEVEVAPSCCLWGLATCWLCVGVLLRRPTWAGCSLGHMCGHMCHYWGHGCDLTQHAVDHAQACKHDSDWGMLRFALHHCISSNVTSAGPEGLWPTNSMSARLRQCKPGS